MGQSDFLKKCRKGVLILWLGHYFSSDGFRHWTLSTAGHTSHTDTRGGRMDDAEKLDVVLCGAHAKRPLWVTRSQNGAHRIVMEAGGMLGEGSLFIRHSEE